MKKALLTLLIAAGFTVSAQAASVKVLNKDAWFPEGPIWYKDKLFYVEYGRNTVMTWDGKKNDVFWKQDGCGPSAVLPTASGDFVVTCYDSNSIGRISADGKTLDPYTKDKDGHPFVGPNDFAVHSTRRQLKRYLEVWNNPRWQAMAQAGIDALPPE